MSLPDFDTPTHGELRAWYRRYRQDENVWRLILEVQRSRDQMARLASLLSRALKAAERAEFGRLTGADTPLRDATTLAQSERIRVVHVHTDERSRRGAPNVDSFPASDDDDDGEPSARASHGRRQGKTPNCFSNVVHAVFQNLPKALCAMGFSFAIF